MDDCSKNGKKAAEAMSLSKEGKSSHRRLQKVNASVVIFGHKYVKLGLTAEKQKV